MILLHEVAPKLPPRRHNEAGVNHLMCASHVIWTREKFVSDEGMFKSLKNWKARTEFDTHLHYLVGKFGLVDVP